MMNNVHWKFDTQRYLSLDQFISDVNKHNQELADGDEDFHWHHDQIMMNSPRVAFEYVAWVSGRDQLLTCEVPIDDEETAFAPEREQDGLYPVDIHAEVYATNRTSFSAGELLWIAHSLQANKVLGDHTFFEGFEVINLNAAVPALFIAKSD
ncbi:MAG: hypothetical protein Q4A82_03305 [Corynebacterium sp.]|nr:hypothetical protein [Corynebacterium sp.]